MTEFFLEAGDRVICKDASDLWHTHQSLWALGYDLKVNFMAFTIDILGRRSSND